jgi:Na+:H+ antiporter, NhaA family
MNDANQGHPARPPHLALWPLRFISVQAASGMMLLLAAALALAWANSPWSASYRALWHWQPGLAVLLVLPAQDLHFLVNDGLMTVFFLVVGLEIRQEIRSGALSDPRVATLPVLAALGGVVAPALIYIVFNADPVTRRGWAIPTATDIAFAVGVLSLMKGVPAALRILLLSLAIIDDIVAILIIAFVYSRGIAMSGLGLAIAAIGLVLALQWLGVRAMLAYVLPGALLWLGMLSAGIHPTLSGVILGLLTPADVRFGRARPAAAAPPRADAPAARLVTLLHPWVAFGIMPLFALANAGITFQRLSFAAAAPLGLAGGIILGLVIGKPVGIFLTAVLAVRGGWCALPAGVRWRDMLVLGCLGGIGFTMSIFIADLAFEGTALLDAAKFSVLRGSVLAAGLGLLVGLGRAAHSEPLPQR